MHRNRTPFVRIPLSRGKATLVSPEDAERLTGTRWHAARAKQGWIARRYVRVAGKWKPQLLSRFLMGNPPGVLVDHANGNTLDNRRENIRHATTAQNTRNMRRKRNNTSGFKGVQWDPEKGRWMARIRVDGRRVFLGRFDTPEEAACAYDDAARQRFGAFARLNFGDEYRPAPVVKPPIAPRWALAFERCQSCGTTERQHKAGGLCRRCYGRDQQRRLRGYDPTRYRV